MATSPTSGDEIFHLALAHEWTEALARGIYERSTRGASLAEVGFVHCAFADQVQGVADAFYVGADVILIRIDVDRVGAPVIVEALGTPEPFPHVYGPVPLDAVVDTAAVPIGPDGRLQVTDLVES